MVNLTDPNTNPPGGRTWAVAFVGTAGDLPLMIVDGSMLLPATAPSVDGVDGMDYSESRSTADWPPDPARITVSEVQRGESEAATYALEAEQGLASGTVRIAFDADGDSTYSAGETVTVGVRANASTLQKALRSLEGALANVEVELDDGFQRARNGGKIACTRAR